MQTMIKRILLAHGMSARVQSQRILSSTMYMTLLQTIGVKVEPGKSMQRQS